MSAPFRFKKFCVAQDRCAMKIGTDGVLLGAWVSVVHKPCTVLDIGTGTGLIALMLAQRSSAELIDALEIEENAYEQCVENFEASPWGDRLFCYHASLEEFVEEIEESYDLIVSNPPFFEPSLASTFSLKNEGQFHTARKKARSQNALSFSHLIDATVKLLSERGTFHVIVPFQSQEKFITLAKQAGLHLQKRTTVQGRKEAPVKRSLLQFGFEKKKLLEDRLILEIERHQYTPEYTELVNDFYLAL